VSEVVVAEVVRSGFVESRHFGSIVALDPAGAVVLARGSVDAPLFARSCNKPIQATAMVRAGLSLRGRLLALVSASHSGEPMHLEGVREILAGAELPESALQTPPDFPLAGEARDAYVAAGGVASPIAMNCSGKHAGMLATCVAAGWPVDTYRDPGHPLQRRIAAELGALAGQEATPVGVDGCGAPLFGTTLVGLARAFGRIRQAREGTPERAVAEAIGKFPEYVSGTRRDEAQLLRAYPDAVAKAGAEGCYAVAMPDGTAVALKVGDGGARARPVVMAAALRELGFDHPVLDDVGHVPVLGGGKPVGEIRAAF
jgi:L-asparaginase II